MNTAPIKMKWEEELGLEILGENWERALQLVNQLTLNARHYLIHLKIIHRQHCSKVKLSKIYPDLSPLHDKCRSRFTAQFCFMSKALKRLVSQLSSYFEPL